MEDIIKEFTNDLPEQSCFTFSYSKNFYPDEIIFNKNVFLPNGKKKDIVTNFACVKFYKHLKIGLAVKFIPSNEVRKVYDEVVANLRLIDPPLNYFVPIMHVSNYNNYFVIISMGMKYDICDKIEFDKKTNTKPQYDDILHILKCILNALHHLNSLHLVYNDLKTENIVFDKKSNSYKLIDFESITKFNEIPIHKETVVGTDGTMSLQRLQKQVSSISDDIWSLSIVLFEYITKKQSPWLHIKDFKSRTLKKAIKNIKYETQHWTKIQQKNILQLFLKMNMYLKEERISLYDLMNEKFLF